MISLVFAVVLMAAGQSEAAPAPQPAAAPSAASPGAKPDKAKKDEMVCKREAVIGSRLPSKTCRTRAEWDQIAVDTKDQFNQNQRNRALSGN